MTSDRDQLRSQVLERLKGVDDPELHRSLVDLGMIKRAEVTDDNRADIQVELTTPACPMKGKIRGDIEAALGDLGLAGIDIEFTADVTKRRGLPEKREIPGVRNIVSVGAGKGGVGKSTVACNLAIALARQGARVGLLDSDIYGPNLPLMMGITRRPEVKSEKIIPLEAHGVRVMSIGVLIEEGTPVVWRGPMLHKAIEQFLFDVAWGDLDYLIVDLPPGTGDVQLSLSQHVPVTGAVVVCTPSLVAVQDVRKAITMFRNFQTPVLGVIENMRGFTCPKCGETTDVFSTGAAEALAKEQGVPYLGSIPLHPGVREHGDGGRPTLVAEPAGAVAQIFTEIAQGLAGQISIANFEHNRDNLVQIKT